jgi:uncharacterized membrane protein YbhN (UPF0104 family)
VLPIVLQGLRWSALVRKVSEVPRRIPVASLAVGQAASAFLPLRAGEAVRVELLSRHGRLSRATALGTVALDHGVNLFVMFAFAAALPLLLPVPRWMAAAIWAGMAGMIVAAMLLLRLARDPSAATTGRLAGFVARARSGLLAARKPRAVAEATLFAALSWAMEVLVARLSLDAFHLPHGIPHALLVLVGVNLALIIPAPPASLGSFELGAGSALVAFGGSTAKAAAFALGYHAIQLLPAMMLGGLMLASLRKPLRQLNEA